MSISVMQWAWGLDIPTGEKMVLLALADRANDDGECWPGYSSLADKCSMTERNVMRLIHKLEERGLLAITERRNPESGVQKTNLYHLKTGVSQGDNLSPGQGDICDISQGDIMSPNTSVNSNTRDVEVTSLRSVTPTSPAATSQNTPEKRATAIGFDPEKRQFVNISAEQYAAWDAVYKRIDVDAEIEKAELWLVANPRKRKQNYLRFLNNWLSKASDKAAQPVKFTQQRPGAAR